MVADARNPHAALPAPAEPARPRRARAVRAHRTGPVSYTHLMYVRKEALLSSQIEGTQCTFDDLLSPSQTQLHHKDVADVVNYVRAVDRGVEPVSYTHLM